VRNKGCLYLRQENCSLRVLDEYDLQDSFQKRINPGSRELPAHNTTVLPASMITPGVSLRNENLGARALDEIETGRETSSAREEHIIS